MDYSKSFYNDYDLYEVFSELNKCHDIPGYKFDYDKYSTKVMVYLDWIESISSLIERNVIDFYTIDNIMTYRFFIIVNNPVVQERELIPFSTYYRGTYYLYNRWHKYETQRELAMPLYETALHLSKGYDETLKNVFEKVKNK